MNRERCGRDYEHPAHKWQEGDPREPEYHLCDGSSDALDSLEACEHADVLFEQGYYEDVS